MKQPARIPAQNTDLNPHEPQQAASNPEHSVWVGASAGTGKTKVLTDRVLRLLLPRANGETGTSAHKILCLTFTKAAANEMALRISKILSRWAIMPHKDLETALEDLLGRPPQTQDTEAARRLFANIIDTPGDLKIMTIHSFCQSVLGRFPLESGLNPNFKILEEQDAAQLLAQAQQKIIKQAATKTGGPLETPLSSISSIVNEDQFTALLKNIISERHQFLGLLKRHFNNDGLYTALCAKLNIPAGLTEEHLIATTCDTKNFEHQSLKHIAQIMIEHGHKTDKKAGEKIARWLSLDPTQRSNIIELTTYKSAFFTAENNPRAKLCGKDTQKNSPNSPDILKQECDRLETLKNQINTIKIAAFTRDLCALAEQAIHAYEDLKAQTGALDFDDLIFKTLTLLRGKTQGTTGNTNPSNAAWVHYKLDQGLDHILIDEAQDTNPEQWQIIEALCDDFFSGQSAREDQRTIFIVGDEKQSIYSFQRASPEEFQRMKQTFAQKIKAAQKHWSPLELNISFRSTHAVLQAVDHVFADKATRRGLGDTPIRHHAFRQGQAGLVELWPLFKPDEKAEKTSLWDLPSETQNSQTSTQKLANHIAQHIQSLIESKDNLEPRKRPVQAGDIMILVRSRGALIHQIARALKINNIPVSGIDRIVLNEELAVQDLIAAAKFALLPQDDLNLACLLKSPLIGLSEQELYDNAYGRPADLWSHIKKTGRPKVTSYLQALIAKAKQTSPYNFINEILLRPCPADQVSARRSFIRRLGNDAIDSLDEFLNAALLFEQKQTPSLQKFIYAQERGASEIKREQSSQSGMVRIMTIHGSKGLQAPIIILPDTTSSSKSAPNRADKRFLWPRQTGFDLPLWSSHKDLDTPLYTQAMSTLNERLDDEYRRLLYVAMTRAEDRLYIAGHKTTREPSEECWYNLIHKGLKTCKDIQRLEDGTLRLSCPQIAPADRTDKAQQDKTAQRQDTAPLPAWLYKAAPKEKDTAPDLLNPSRLEETAASPVRKDQETRFLRGNLTHKLLQILPTLPRDQWKTSAEHYIKQYGATLFPKVQNSMLQETLAILNHPELSALFGPNSSAEVPVTGHIKGKGLISGQIDRLVIQEHKIYIIDYKTNRPPPTDPTDIPPLYRNQMQLYATLLQQIHPNKTIHAALLWTDGPTLMPVPLDSPAKEDT